METWLFFKIHWQETGSPAQYVNEPACALSTYTVEQIDSSTSQRIEDHAHASYTQPIHTDCTETVEKVIRSWRWLVDEMESKLERRERKFLLLRSRGHFTLKNSQAHILRCTAKKLGFDSFLGLHLKMWAWLLLRVKCPEEQCHFIFLFKFWTCHFPALPWIIDCVNYAVWIAQHGHDNSPLLYIRINQSFCSFLDRHQLVQKISFLLRIHDVIIYIGISVSYQRQCSCLSSDISLSQRVQSQQTAR